MFFLLFMTFFVIKKDELITKFALYYNIFIL